MLLALFSTSTVSLACATSSSNAGRGWGRVDVSRLCRDWGLFMCEAGSYDIRNTSDAVNGKLAKESVWAGWLDP